jgi:hypothetical protein
VDTSVWWYLFDIEAEVWFWAQTKALCSVDCLKSKINFLSFVGLCDGVQYVACAGRINTNVFLM